MARESKESYRTGDQALDFILNRIAARLDLLEGLRPDLSAGKYTLGADKALSTETLGDIASQDADSIAITGGIVSGITFVNNLLTYYDENDEIIHQFSSNSIGQFATDPWSADMQEIPNMSDLVAAMANQLTVTDDEDGSVTLSIPDPLIVPGAMTLGGKLTGGTNEIEGSNFDINGGDITGVTINDSLVSFYDAAEEIIHQVPLSILLKVLQTDYWTSHCGGRAEISGGTIERVTMEDTLTKIKDADEETIHQFPVENLASYTRFV